MDKNLQLLMEVAKEINDGERYPSLKTLPLGVFFEIIVMLTDLQKKIGANAPNK